MLTQNEKNWLEEREKRPVPCVLNESWNLGTNWDSGFPFCPPEMTERLCPRAFNQDCHWCHLKYARLTVEQEMEAEHDR